MTKSFRKGFYHGNRHNKDNVSTYQNNFTGNISCLATCYDLEYIRIRGHAVYGEVKSLNKLQKLYYVELITNSAVTGVKEDLYNSGANCTTFTYFN